MHVAFYLQPSFYSAIAAALVETLQTVNAVRASPAFSFEFVSRVPRAVSKSGIVFSARTKPSRKVDVLVLLATATIDPHETVNLLDGELPYVTPFIDRAIEEDATIAAICAAPYFLAGAGVLDGKRSTISWWLKDATSRRFPRVRWQPSRLVIRQGRIYTSGAGFAGLDLVTTMLVDLGFAKEERMVRKLMVLPPMREFQSPYEMVLPEQREPFEKKLNAVAKGSLEELSLDFLARRLGMSPRTLARRFSEELGTSPGKWVQEKRLERARWLLEGTKLDISEICHRVGYHDVPSFSRLFSRTTGMTPGEYRKHLRG
ncbi:GlxA family transcriptional regulator [Pendulispora albinea]|uniref:Helix-turn-helix domain-containing protein n=1 Tax=Pendulispora albinea TaxID=2741071 RepID=A0ABZ2LSV0_9BACT